MIATDFVFDNERLSDYGMIICSFDGAQEGAVSSGADITFNTATSSGGDIFKLYSSNYTEPYSTSFAICKNPCVSDEAALNPYLSSIEIATLQRWLCRPEKFYKFQLDDPDYAETYWRGSFSAQTYLISGKVAGLILTFYTDAPYGYKNDVKLKYELSKGDSIVVHSISDEIGYLFPNFKITFNSDCDEFVLINNRDTKRCVIKNCKNREIITIDGRNLIISSTLSTHDIAKDFNYAFPRLFNTYTDTQNVFDVNTDCNIEISYAPARKVGM